MIKVDKFIAEKQIILNTQTEQNNPLNSWHILLCFDDNYALPAGINILSIIANNVDKSLHFHLFMQNVSQQNRDKFKNIDHNGIIITEYIIDQNFKIHSDNIKSFPISACFRLIAPSLLVNETNKLLYVDSDTLCVGNLTSLFDMTFTDQIIAAVPDVEYMQQSQCTKYSIEYGTYINSGVMMFNTKEWCKQNMTEKLLNLLNSGEVYQYPDQDVMNILVGNKRILLEKKYNNLIGLTPNGEEDQKIPAGTKIIHYVTKNKPWHISYRTQLFDGYLTKSSWKNDPLPLYEPRKISSVRQFSRLMFKQKHYGMAIKYYCEYLRRKFLDKK